MFFFFNDTATTEIYTLSLHDALPISLLRVLQRLVSLRDFLELRFGVLLLGHVRVILAGELAIGGLDLVGAGGLLQTRSAPPPPPPPPPPHPPRRPPPPTTQSPPSPPP